MYMNNFFIKKNFPGLCLRLVSQQSKLVKKGFFNSQEHPFHMVRPSAWPFLRSVLLPTILLIFVVFMHGYKIILCPFWQVVVGLCVLLFGVVVVGWLFDVHFEAVIEGQHTRAVQRNLLFGFVLFIISEIMLFVSFFWAFGHLAVHPSIRIGEVWPPFGIQPLNPFGLPFVNTILLLSSGVFVTFAHRSINLNRKLAAAVFKLERFIPQSFIKEYYQDQNKSLTAVFTCFDKLVLLSDDRFDSWSERFLTEDVIVSKGKVYVDFSKGGSSVIKQTEVFRIIELKAILRWYVRIGLGGAIGLGVLFTFCQLYEYNTALFDISDSAYGSTFYRTTGLHGLHVLVGTVILCVQLVRFRCGFVFVDHHVGFLTALWYWHFVDVVWLVVFGVIYVWGSSIALFV